VRDPAPRPVPDELFRAIVESQPLLFAVVEADATFRYAKPAFEPVLGDRPDELVRRNARRERGSTVGVRYRAKTSGRGRWVLAEGAT
jgi:hypothetical protein